MIRIRQLKILASKKEDDLKIKCAKKLGIKEKDIKEIKIVRKSIDARKKPEIYYDLFSN